MVYEFGKVLAEIDENLIRRDLTPSQRAKLGARRKAAYLEVHPETGNGKAPGAGRGKAPKNAKFAPSPSFVADTARAAGRSKRSVEMDVARAMALGADLDRVAGTSLDKGVELDTLAKMPQPAARRSR